LGIPPPGDFRNCIAALADDEALITQLFQYRFGQGHGLHGHSFGNLFITALSAVTGSFEQAILETGRVLAVQGRIVPSTLEDVTLVADIRTRTSDASSGEDGDQQPGLTRVRGESAIPKAGRPIERVFLRPDSVRAYPGAVRAILDADLVVAGPGSLFTSILPNLLVREIRQAVAVSPALKIFVCNVATQPGETDGLDVGEHVETLENHVGRGLFDYVIANSNLVQSPDQPHLQPVRPVYPLNGSFKVVEADLVDQTSPWRHDARKLADCVMQCYANLRE
jgi:uncharacterized cofD-like protein